MSPCLFSTPSSFLAHGLGGGQLSWQMLAKEAEEPKLYLGPYNQTMRWDTLAIPELGMQRHTGSGAAWATCLKNTNQNGGQCLRNDTCLHTCPCEHIHPMAKPRVPGPKVNEPSLAACLPPFSLPTVLTVLCRVATGYYISYMKLIVDCHLGYGVHTWTKELSWALSAAV